MNKALKVSPLTPLHSTRVYKKKKKHSHHPISRTHVYNKTNKQTHYTISPVNRQLPTNSQAKLRGVSFSNSHQQNRRVLLLKFPSGGRVSIKPRPLYRTFLCSLDDLSFVFPQGREMCRSDGAAASTRELMCFKEERDGFQEMFASWFRMRGLEASKIEVEVFFFFFKIRLFRFVFFS